MSNSPVVVSDPDELLRYGVCRVPIPGEIDWKKWATELSKLTPAIMAAEGDKEYAFYRNILQEPDFPFDAILSDTSAIGRAIQKYFAINSRDEIRLDDAFCIHYNTSQQDTSGAKHMDPSDITVNMCLEKTDNVVGSQVLFYGTKSLHLDEQPTQRNNKDESFRFLVSQEAGYATLHWGAHPHATTPLMSGKRTNIVLTYCYKDTTRSDVSKRTCYFDE